MLKGCWGWGGGIPCLMSGWWWGLGEPYSEVKCIMGNDHMETLLWKDKTHTCENITYSSDSLIIYLCLFLKGGGAWKVESI